MNNKVSLLGENIRKIRQAKDIDRNKLSRLTGIDNIVLYEIESGDINSLSEIYLEKIAKALDVNMSTLLGNLHTQNISVNRQCYFNTFDIELSEKIKQLSNKTGIPTSELLDKALDLLLKQYNMK